MCVNDIFSVIALSIDVISQLAIRSRDGVYLKCMTISAAELQLSLGF